MVEFIPHGVYLINGEQILIDTEDLTLEEIRAKLNREGLSSVPEESIERDKARAQTITYRILTKHNTSGDWRDLKIRFDSLASHDITYVGIVQTARASGLKEFPVPYLLTNCHNSLCAVGGTINEDDHLFGLSAARRYGGIYVPAHQAVIHQYARELMAGCGEMILGSDSHTRYGALGTMGIGEGGPEIVKQLLERTYDLTYPEVVAVYLEGEPAWGVGPQDVALAIIREVFPDGLVKNKVLEFVGPGVSNLSIDYRNGIDIMTTETTCLSSIWRTDQKVKEYFTVHGRPESYKRLNPGKVAYYEGLLRVDLSRIEPMIALPFHPSNAWPISEVNRDGKEILRAVEAEAEKQFGKIGKAFRLQAKMTRGRLKMDQGVVAGCAGGSFENIGAMAEILNEGSIGDGEFTLSIYPASQPIHLGLIKNGIADKLLATGATIRTAFCGPCFGAGDVPANGALSARHTTRNFPNREGSKPVDGQLAAVALMDARSIAATAVNGGLLTPATEGPQRVSSAVYSFESAPYKHRVYQGFGKARPEEELRFGPNITDWPEMIPLPENLLLKVAAVIKDPVTTTDELIPSGETSSYRSNPLRLAEFTLSRKVPEYVGRAKKIQEIESLRRRSIKEGPVGQVTPELLKILASVTGKEDPDPDEIHELLGSTGLGSVVVAVKPGDGSAREQAASCQKVLGGWANMAVEYATKRYRSNLINWGMLPFILSPEELNKLEVHDLIFIPDIRKILDSTEEEVRARVIGREGGRYLDLRLNNLSLQEREIILAGCLINYYAKGRLEARG